MPLVQQLTFVRPTTLGFDDPDELDEMPRRQLQALAKKHGIRANQKTVIIIEALCELFAAEQKRLNQEIEAATLAASGVEPSTANVSMVTEGSFVDVPRSPSDAVNASACSPSSQDDDAASVGDICMSVANAEAAMAVEAEEHMDKGEAPTATNDAPAPAAAPTPVPSAVAATPVVAAPAATEASAKPAEAKTTPRKAAKTGNTPKKARGSASGKRSAKRARPVKDWNKVHSKLFAQQVSISDHMKRRGTPKKRPASAPNTQEKAAKAGSARTPKSFIKAPSATSTTRTTPKRTTPTVKALKAKPFVPAKSSKKPTQPQAPKLGVARMSTPGTTPASVHAAPLAASASGSKIPMRPGMLKHSRRRPTPHPAMSSNASRLPAAARAQAAAARASSGTKGSSGYKPYTGTVRYKGDSLFSPNKARNAGKKKKVFDLKASLAKPLSYKPHLKPPSATKSNENNHIESNRTASKCADKSLARASTYKARPGMNGTNGRQAQHAKRSQEARASKLAMRRAAAKAH